MEIELKNENSKSIIHYQNIGITFERDTTCNFHQEENKVVLECVNRLLDIGYLPKDIILEKKYEHGRQSEDWMDVVVMQNNKVYAIIECKKDINEYTKEWNKTKQDEGQFFTPIPIARFMNYCIPYNHIIDDNIRNDNQDFIPKVIDYSCGAGHFLTEAMDRIQNYIDTIDKTKQGNKIKSQLNIWQKDEDGVVLKWADKFIFDIKIIK